ncbi:hypothetical protein CKY51_13790 [Xanthomonas maliensis]|nr:hypothetical protein CKY51_13790 [Xanthomonas maliensis]
MFTIGWMRFQRGNRWTQRTFHAITLRTRIHAAHWQANADVPGVGEASESNWMRDTRQRRASMQ